MSSSHADRGAIVDGTAEAARCWELTWDRGRAEIFALGASLHNLTFTMRDGSSVQPLAEAPWRGDPQVTTDPEIPPHLKALGGEWPCVPFGTTEVDPSHHGHGSDNLWQMDEHTAEAVTLSIEYPEEHPIARLERRIRGVRGAPAVELELSVLARRDCRLPVGLHPIFRLPESGQRIHVDPGAFQSGHTFPRTFEPGVSRLAVDDRFSSLAAVPLAGGGTADVSCAPAALREEILLMIGTAGQVTVSYPDDGYAITLDWNAEDLPALVVWLSNCGRAAAPWHNRFRGIGIEPVAAYFDNAAIAASAPPGSVLGVDFSAGLRWTTRYRISASALDVLQDEGRRK